MDVSSDEPAGMAAVEPEMPPGRNTRSAQRRRAAKGGSAVAAASSDAAATAETTPADPAPPAAVLFEDAPAPADPTPFTPPAPMADTSTEDRKMDYATTADTAVDTANDVAEQMADRGQAAFADMNGRAKDAMEKGGRMAEEIGAFGKGNMEALVESSKIAVKGIETLGQDAAEFTRKSFESATAAMKTLAATRSPTEFMKLQGDYARAMFDTMIAETSRSTEKMLKLANDVAQPLSNRVAVAADKMKVAA